MRNPFTLIKQKIGDMFSKRKQEAVIQKQKDTKVETHRGSSGGGSKSITADKVAITAGSGTYARMRNNAATKRHKANKVARRSRRINRLAA